MSIWLGIVLIFAWDEVTLEVDLLVESILAVDEASSLLNTVPLLGTLAIAMSPPLILSETLLLIMLRFRDLSSESETIWMGSWLGVALVP